MKARSRFSSIPKKHSSRRAHGKSRAAAWDLQRIVAELKRLGEPRDIQGIRSEKVLGVSRPKIDELASNIGRHDTMTLELWKTGIQDARILAGLVAEPEKVTAALMDR
jgi:3-methyladenine DNA glycosylase AlkD